MNFEIVKNFKNVHFNGKLVLDNIEQFRSNFKIKSKTSKLIAIAMRDGACCDTCKKEISFKLCDDNALLMYAGDVPMTMDHDLLKSLGGSDSIINQHLLCKDCNKLRDNKFANYDEFKYWYDTQLANKLNPKTTIKYIFKNYSYVDFNKNGYTINLAQTIKPTLDVIPAFIEQELMNCYIKHGRINPLFVNLSVSSLLYYTDNAWNNFFNSFAVKLIKLRTGAELTIPVTEYQFKTRNKNTLTAFCNKLTTCINIEYKKAKRELVDIKKQSSTVIADDIKSHINTPSSTKHFTFWNRLKDAFKILTAA